MLLQESLSNLAAAKASDKAKYEANEAPLREKIATLERLMVGAKQMVRSVPALLLLQCVPLLYMCHVPLLLLYCVLLLLLYCVMCDAARSIEYAVR